MHGFCDNYVACSSLSFVFIAPWCPSVPLFGPSGSSSLSLSSSLSSSLQTYRSKQPDPLVGGVAEEGGSNVIRTASRALYTFQERMIARRKTPRVRRQHVYSEITEFVSLSLPLNKILTFFSKSSRSTRSRHRTLDLPIHFDSLQTATSDDNDSARDNS